MEGRPLRGFTLIELLVVIAIIAMLSTVVLASLNTARARARDTARIQSLQQLRTALILYYTENGSFPAGSNTSSGDWAGTFKTSLAPFMSQLPVDPQRNVTGPPVWQYFGMTNCGATGSNCSWLNSPQGGTACAGKIILYAFGTEGAVEHQECTATNARVMTVIVGDI